jgi:hypothetical protein
VDEWRRRIAEGGREGRMRVELGREPAGQSKARRLKTTCNDGEGRSTIREYNKGANERRRRIAEEGGREGRSSLAGNWRANRKCGVWRPREAIQRDDILLGNTIRAEGRKGAAEERRREGGSEMSENLPANQKRGVQGPREPMQ